MMRYRADVDGKERASGFVNVTAGGEFRIIRDERSVRSVRHPAASRAVRRCGSVSPCR